MGTLGDGPLRPAEFSAQMLQALRASEGRRRRRKRNTTPDRIGLSLKAGLLERAITADPPPAAFEGWLLEQVTSETVGSGALRAIATQLLDEYRTALADPHFRQWLADGAPSADAAPTPDEGTQ